MRVESFNLRAASQGQYAGANAFLNRIRKERLPDDPPIPLEEDIRRWQNIPPVVDVSAWIVWSGDGSEVIAFGDITVFRTNENPHLAEFGIDVLREMRRRGIGTRLLARIADVVAREGRRVMITSTRNTIPAGEAFLRRLGAKLGLTSHTNQLDLRDLNRDLIHLWQERARERAADFELVLWTEGYPEEELEGLAKILEAMNLAPRGELEVEDFHWTPEHIRQFERQDRARGYEAWMLVARERATGNYAGFTEVAWHPNRPEILIQRGTGVLPGYQNRGLGRWLKAAMLEKVLRDRPQVKRIRTGNADSNAPMLQINTELGFKPYQAHSVWQLDLAQVQDYLYSSSAFPPSRAR